MNTSPSSYKKLVLELENKCKYCGFYDNSFKRLTYSEYKTKKAFEHNFTKVIFIPFRYKNQEIFIVTSRALTKSLT